MLFPHGRWLLCPPSFFNVSYEINPWMDVQNTPHTTRANKQWRELHHTLIRLGAYVNYVEPQQGNPDLVFTANAGLVKDNKVVISRFRHPERQGEEPLFREWFQSRGFETLDVTTGCFEGEGDALFAGEILFCGHGFRSDAKVYEEVASLLNVKQTVMCELQDPRFYHLDICFCPLTPEKALYNEAGLTADSVTEMKKHIEMIPVPPHDAKKFVCNSVVLGDSIVTPADCEDTHTLLRSHGFTPYSVDLSEFLKGGGAAKCLSLCVGPEGRVASK